VARALIRTVRAIKTGLLILGLLILGILVHRIGTEPILEALRHLTWWQFLLVCVPYGLAMALDTLGWRYAFARDRAPYLRLLGARIAGEAINVVTALGAMGGEPVKAWLVRRDVSYEESVPAVVIAKTTITIAQALFLLLGIGVAVALAAEAALVQAMLWLLAVEIVAVAGFLGAQLAGLVARTGRLLTSFGVVGGASTAHRLDEALRGYYLHRWRRLALSVAFHLLGWLLNAVDAFVTLWALGTDTSLAMAVVIEALGSGVRFATFLVPANLGAFESANAAAFAALGFGAGAGLAFSLVRRARQAVWVALGLLILLAMRWTAGATPGPARVA
jgi:uncharacterized protein (TIRG00374 family)